MNEIYGKAPLNNSAKWGRGGALAIGTMTSQSTPQPITGPLLARAPGLQPRLAQWLMRPCTHTLTLTHTHTQMLKSVYVSSMKRSSALWLNTCRTWSSRNGSWRKTTTVWVKNSPNYRPQVQHTHTHLYWSKISYKTLHCGFLFYF